MLSRLGLGARAASSPLRNQLLRNQLRAFTTTRPQRIVIPFLPRIEQPAGNIVGTVNDAYKAPAANKAHGSRHWTFERITMSLMTPLMVLPFVTGSSTALIDGSMSALLLYHSMCGFQSCITDYIPRRVYGVWNTYAMSLLTFGTLVAAYGIYVIESTEKQGLFGVFKRLWFPKKALDEAEANAKA